VIPKK